MLHRQDGGLDHAPAHARRAEAAALAGGGNVEAVAGGDTDGGESLQPVRRVTRPADALDGARRQATFGGLECVLPEHGDRPSQEVLGVTVPDERHKKAVAHG